MQSLRQAICKPLIKQYHINTLPLSHRNLSSYGYHVTMPLFNAPVTKKAGKKGAGGPTAVVKADLSLLPADVIPINIYKDQKDPTLLADDQYPEWLWPLNEDLESFEELQAMIDNADGNYKVLSLPQLVRYERLASRNTIKKVNTQLAKR